MRRALCLAALLAGCAAGARGQGKVAPGTDPGRAVQEQDVGPKVAYERILGSFSIEPDLAIYVSPYLAKMHLGDWGAPSALERLAQRFERVDHPRGAAIARLNLCAVLWSQDETEGAYAEAMRALNSFSEIGDLEGLAHAHEWIGFMMLQSDEIEPAGEHLAVAYQLFSMLDNDGAKARVLDYAEAP